MHFKTNTPCSIKYRVLYRNGNDALSIGENEYLILEEQVIKFPIKLKLKPAHAYQFYFDCCGLTFVAKRVKTPTFISRIRPGLWLKLKHK